MSELSPPMRPTPQNGRRNDSSQVSSGLVPPGLFVAVSVVELVLAGISAGVSEAVYG